MAIVSSILIRDAHTQADGSRYVKEIHTASDGKQIVIGPFKVPGAEAEASASARMAARVTSLEAGLAESETDAILNGA